MIHVEITKGNGLFEKNKRAGLLARIEAVATTSQLEKLAELSESPKARKKLDTSFAMIKSLII